MDNGARSPFPDDQMLRRLHEIRVVRQKRTRDLPPADYAAHVEQEALALLREHGFTVQRQPDGTEVVCRMKETRQVA